MGAQVVSLFQRPAPLRDWSQQELAEFYRVENALLQAGMRIETDRGVTDDGEPWFAFCRAEDGEVFIHFARINGQYIIAGPAFDGISKGWDFAALVRDLISRHPLVQMGPARKSSNIFMHPAALLIAVVGTAFFKTGEAKADDGSKPDDGGRRLMLSISANSPVVGAPSSSIAVEAHQTMTLVAAAMAAATLQAQAGEAPISALAVRLLSSATVVSARPIEQAVDGLAIGHGVVRGGGAVAEVSAWLSLAVVLNDLAAGAPQVSDTSVAVSPRTEDAFAPRIEQLIAAPQAVEPQQQAVSHQPLLMLVDLAPGPLPDVSAVRLARDMGLFDKVPVLHVNELPRMLLDFIAGGQHVSVAPTVEAPDTTVIPDPAPVAELPVVVDPPADLTGIVDVAPIVDVTPIIEPVVAPPVVLEPVTPIAPTPVVTPPVSGADVIYSSAEIQEAINHFLQYTPNVQLIASGDQMVLVDVWIKYGLLAEDKVTTVTFTMEDGSTISLIGSHWATHDPDLFGAG